MVDYSRIDVPELLSYVFYPRPDAAAPPPDAFDFSVAVEPGIDVGCRFYLGNSSWPSILFFHGNGEVASDYDEMAPYYLEREINLIVADYRGYGRSGGTPTLTDTAKDCRPILVRTCELLKEKGLRQDLVVMGRSLGSISAMELASSHPHLIKGVIVESGFVCIIAVIFNLGLPLGGKWEGLDEIEEQCANTAQGVTIPALVIHGEEDSLVPIREGKRLYEALGSENKTLATIEDADHNTIAFVDIDRYFDEIRNFVRSVTQS